MVWERIPKTRFVCLDKLELGVYDAIANFKTLDIFKLIKLEPGFYTVKACHYLNRKQIFRAGYKNSDRNSLGFL